MSGLRVWHYDGETALRRSAALVDKGEAFVLVEDGRVTGPFLWSRLRARDADTGPPSYGLHGASGWRMGFVEAPPPALAAKLPRAARYGRAVDRIGLWPASLVFACLAALVVAVVLRTPAMVARMVPASWEKRMGDLMVGDFGDRGCDDRAGRAALDAMLARLTPDRDRPQSNWDVHVVNVPMINAVTLPGGRIVLFDGLLKAAASPDEVAGVIGHELGHVRHRDVTEALIRQLGLSVVLGGLDGNIGGYTNTLLATAYSRKAEAAADGFSLELMREAAVSPAATAGFFRRLGGRGGRVERLLTYMNSHPVSVDRARRFEAGVDKRAAYRPVLDAEQWAALKGICKATPRETGWRF